MDIKGFGLDDDDDEEKIPEIASSILGHEPEIEIDGREGRC